MSRADWAAAVTEAALGGYLAMNPDAPSQLKRLHGAVLSLEVRDLGIRLYLQVEQNRLRVTPADERTPTVAISGDALSLATIGRGRILGAGVEIAGDTAVARAFQELLDRRNLDPEEPLSRLVGDVPAHQIGRALRGVLGWGSQAVGSLGRTVGEFLQEEHRDLPSVPEMRHFLDQVDLLRGDFDRLETRLRRLERRLSGTEEAS
jgi:ubiquinone biosynthesis protein UbiJ